MFNASSELHNDFQNYIIEIKWSRKMVLIIYFCNHIIMLAVLKMKNQLIQLGKVTKIPLDDVKEGKGLKINLLTPNKLLTRPPLLLVQIKNGNKSNK